MVYKTIYTEVEVDVDLEEFETDDLIEELERRGETVGDVSDSSVYLNEIYYKRRLGQDYQRELDQLIYCVLGKII